MSPYELFDHTADLGLRVRAASYAELLCEAARALTAMPAEKPSIRSATATARSSRR